MIMIAVAIPCNIPTNDRLTPNADITKAIAYKTAAATIVQKEILFNPHTDLFVLELFELFDEFAIFPPIHYIINKNFSCQIFEIKIENLFLRF